MLLYRGLMNALYLLLSFLLCLALTPFAIRIGFSLGAIDYPGGRRVHRNIVARLGGIGVVPAMVISLLVWSLVHAHFSVPVVLGVSGILFSFALGVWDDLVALGSKRKLTAQLVLGAVMYFLGTRVDHIFLAPTLNFDLGLFSLPMTMLFFAGVMNAFNLIDGIDGLASGFASIVLLVLGGLSLWVGHYANAWFCFIIASSATGFLVYNYSPAKIFLGDSGSMSLGFSLAFASVQLLSVTPTSSMDPIPFYVPVVLLALPILDISVAMLRRAIQVTDESLGKCSPLYLVAKVMKKMMSADGGHIHHKLLEKGYTHRKVARFAYALASASALIAGVSIMLPSPLAALLLVLFGFMLYQFVLTLGYEEFLPRDVRIQRQMSAWKRAVGVDRA